MSNYQEPLSRHFLDPHPDPQEDRVRAMLGIHHGPLPAVEREGLQRYYWALVRRLSFPFRAFYHEAVSPLEDIPHAVTVLGLLDPAERLGSEGLMCRVVEDGRVSEVPLVELEVDPQNPNFQLVEDYWYWAWNGGRRGRTAG